MKKSKIISKNTQEIVIYRSGRGNVTLRADVAKETVWATLNQIADLFGRHKSVISRHIKDIFATGELNKNPTVAKNATVQKEGNRKVLREVEFYNLDMILSVGYRVNSKQATQFRIWATETLHDYIIHGMAVNTERIKKLNDDRLNDLTKKISFLQRIVDKRL